MFSFYILFSKSLDKYYLGYTADLDKRLAEHNSGISTFTSRSNDWELKYYESFQSRKEAMLRERQVKNKKSRKYIEWLIKENTQD